MKRMTRAGASGGVGNLKDRRQGHLTDARRTETLNRVAAIIGCLAVVMAIPIPASGANPKSESQKEIIRLRQEVQELKKALQQKESAVAGQSVEAGAPPLPNEPAPVDEAPVSAEPASTRATNKSKATGESPRELGEVVVKARNREEKLQEVPVPVSVINSKALQRDNLVTVGDFTRRVPNLLVNAPNTRQTSIAIRGLGKNSANESMEASVGQIVDNVFLGYVGMSWADFVDIDRVEVLRGPQGTLLGKNTTLGVVNIVTKKPSWTPEYYLDGFVGDREALQGKASASGPIVPGLLAYRGSIYFNHRDGFLKNLFQPSESWLETNRWGGRLQFLLEPSENVSSRIILDRAQSQERINIDPYQVEPETFANGQSRTAGTSLTWSKRLARDYFDGYQPTIGSKDTIDTNDARPLIGNQQGLSGEVNWRLGDYTLTSISAYRTTDFDAKNDSDQTRFSISRGGTLVDAEQVSQEFRLTSPTNRTVDYQIGLFALKSDISSTSRTLYGADAGAFYAGQNAYNRLSKTAIGKQLLVDSLRGVYSNTETQPETFSLAAFGQLNWHITDAATLTFGLRDTWEDKDNSTNKITPEGGKPLTAANYPGATAQDLTDAIGIRTGRLGNVYGFKPGDGFSENTVSWLLSPSYKLTNDVLVYFSASQGSKSGAVQFDSATGNPQNVEAEDVTDFEFGVKSTWLDRSLVLNVNFYNTKVSNYQTNKTVFDPSTESNISFLGNVGGVRMRGVEIDSAYRPFKALTLTLNGSYNDAIYTDYRNAPCPPEVANVQQICDFTGEQVSAAPKFTGFIGIDYRVPIGWGLEAHAFLNNTYRSEANVNSQLSIYGVQKGYNITDAGIGVSTDDGKYDLNLVAKNIFDTEYSTGIGSFSNSSAVGYTLGDARYIGVNFRMNY